MHRNRCIAIAQIVLSCTIFNYAQPAVENLPFNGSTLVAISVSLNGSSAVLTTISTSHTIALSIPTITGLFSLKNRAAMPSAMSISQSASTPSTPTLDSDPKLPNIPSSVPMIAGTLAGIIVIVATVLVIFLVRRRKKVMIRRIRRPFPPHSPRSIPKLFSVAFVEGPPHSISPPSNPRNPFLVAPISPTSFSSINSPTTIIKKSDSRYSFSSEDVELDPRGSAPRSPDESEQPHCQYTFRRSRNYQPPNSDRRTRRNSPSISQSLNSSDVATITTSSSGSIDASHLRQPIALGDLEQKKSSLNSDLFHPLAMLSEDEHLPTPNVSPSSTRLWSTSRPPPPPLERFPLPDDGDSPPAYDTFVN